MHGYGDFGSHTSGTEGWGFGFGVCQQFYTMYITPGSARFEPACRRLSTHGCGDFGSYTSGTGGWGFRFSVFSTVKLSTYRSPELRGGNRLPGGSLITVAAILVCIQVEREVEDLVLV